ncbi:signal transduction histidine kinase [Sinorhizobium fredii]|nr:histidine kinase [Sinorhizobium fredii]AWM27942.1 hypothetical protein AOX55_00005164 [Sinorhizobium fredii CCBAU 25509]
MVSMEFSRKAEAKHSHWPGKGFAGLARNWLLRTDPERLICIGRLLSAAFAILAIYLDPTRPNSLLYESRVVLCLYLLLSIGLIFYPLRRSFDSPAHLFIHMVDAAVVGWLTFLTNELASPFFNLLPFVILAMTMRWGLKGATLGAFIALFVQLVVGIPDLLDGESELNLFIMRSIYFVLIAATLGYFGAYREHSRQRLAQLAKWPPGAIGEDSVSWLGILLEHASRVLGDPHLLVIWRDQELESGCVAYWTRGNLQLVDVKGSEFWQRHDPQHHATDRSESCEKLDALFAELPELSAKPGESECKVSAAAFSSIRFRGCVFVISPAPIPEGGPALTQIIAARLGAELERIALIQSALAEERMRLARDLHDTVLQNLTAARLKLKLISEAVPNTAKAQLTEVGLLLLEQQQCLRKFVEDSRAAEGDSLARLGQTLPAFLQLLKVRWNCDIGFSFGPAELVVPKWMLHEIMQLISEAAANAVRHGRATRLNLVVRGAEGSITLEITDDGSGVPQDAKPQKPFSLSQRVTELGGQLTICTTSPGFGLQITLPTRREGW